MTGTQLRARAENGDPIIYDMASRYWKFGAGEKIKREEFSSGFFMRLQIDADTCVQINIGEPSRSHGPRMCGPSSSINVYLRNSKGFCDLFSSCFGSYRTFLNTHEANRAIDLAFEMLAKELDAVTIDASEASFMKRVADALELKLNAS